MMEFKRQPTDGPTAIEIIEGSVYGSTYTAASGDTIRTIVVAETDHAVVTWHKRRRLWQYFYRQEDRWTLIADCASLVEAKIKAEQRKSEAIAVAEVDQMPDGTPVLVSAQWKFPYHGDNAIRVPCSSAKTGAEIAAMLGRLGMVTLTQVDKSVDSQLQPA